MSKLVELIGDTLLMEGGVEVKTTDVVKDVKAVGLYFSASWCGPCRMTTPKLAEAYKNIKGRGKPFEIIFVSSDHSKKDMDKYFQDMPWKALPFESPLRDELSMKFRVRGIPTLILLDEEGKLITEDGRTAILSDPKGEQFPWKPETPKDILSRVKFFRGSETLGKEALEGKTIGLYFSAHWCPPCKMFTPMLAKFYEQHAKGKDLEVVFVSSDHTEADYHTYRKEMPWITLDYADSKAREALSNNFKVAGIPTLVFLDSNFNLITSSGREKVMVDPEAKNFPWYPKSWKDLSETGEGLNDMPCLVAISEGGGDGMHEEARAAVATVAEDAKERGEANVSMVFFTATESGGILDQIRGLTKTHGAGWLLIIDIPNGGAYYKEKVGSFDKLSVEAFVRKFKAKELKREQMSR